MLRAHGRLAMVVVGLAGCASAGPRDTTAVATTATASGPEAQAPPPATASNDAPPAPAEPAARDPRELGFVSALVAYRSAGKDAFLDASDEDEQAIAACFDRTMPLESREPVVYYVRVMVPNPDHDAEHVGFGHGIGPGGISYPPPGTYAAFEECVRRAIPEVAAPPDVAAVELRIHVHTLATAEGSIGHGAP